MAKTPDDNFWLDQIRCPRYFDFEAALTVPCPSGGDTNPPLRDSVYESDDETRSFFQALEADSSLHHTPHPQENSPPRAELRNVRPIYRHRPSTSFQEYLQNFNESQEVNPSCDVGDPSLPPTSTALVKSPSLQRKAPVTPRRNGRAKASRASPGDANTLGGDIKTPVLESASTPKSKPAKANPSTPSRRQLKPAEELTRKSASNESGLLRRRRPPERVTPPINSISSKSTSGGFGRNKSRKAIARSDDTDELQGQASRSGQRAHPVTFSSKIVERHSSGYKENFSRKATELDLLDVDSDILRMMEEHNRRIKEKKAMNEGRAARPEVESNSINKVDKAIRDKTERRHGAGITVRNRRIGTDLEAFALEEKTQESKPRAPEILSVSKEPPLPESRHHQTLHPQEHQEDSKLQSGRQQNLSQNPVHNIHPSHDGRSDQVRVPNQESRDKDVCLDELLKSENERVLQERKKRLPERRRALQVDKTRALSSLGGRAVQNQQRTHAKVEFTSANEKSRAGAASLAEKDGKADRSHRTRGKENKERDKLIGMKPRKRGLKGFRERSRMGPSASVSSILSTGPSHAQITRGLASTRRRQPCTDKIKALERQKRLEKRLEEDLHELLSQHNSRVQGNRRAYSTEQ